MKKHRIPVYIDQEDMAPLNGIKNETGAALAEIIRRSIKSYIKTYEQTKIPKNLGILETLP